MKALRFAVALTFTAALLTGCAQNTASSSASSLPSATSGSASDTSGSASDTSGQSSAASLDEDLLISRYTDVSALPALDLNLEPSLQFDDRTLVMEDSIENELEYLVYQSYYYEISADFSSQETLLGDSEYLQISVKNGKENFENGEYMTSVTIHALNTLTPEDLDFVADYAKEDLLESINQYALTEYAIVQADLDWTYSQAWLDAGPQVGNGRYMRYFLLGKTEETPEFRWYELYWEGFMEEAP